MKKTIFIKSGGYYETPAVSVSSAINDVFELNLKQFNKTDAVFSLDYVNFQYRLYPPAIFEGAVYAKIDMELLVQKAEEYGFAYIGLVGNETDAIRAKDVLRDLAIVVVNRVDESFINAKTNEPLTGDNVTPLIYCVKLATDTYVMVLSKMMQATSNVINTTKAPIAIKDTTVIGVDDGATIRGQFVDVRFKNIRKHFRNYDLVSGYAVFADAGSILEVDLFKDTPYVTDEFKSNFEIEVESSFPFSIGNGKVSVTTTPLDKKTMGYLTIKLKATPLYEEICSREIKESLTFNFIVSIL